MKKCKHISRKEYIAMKGLIHYQECIECGAIREYNPNKNKSLNVTDSKFWSEWEIPNGK